MSLTQECLISDAEEKHYQCTLMDHWQAIAEENDKLKRLLDVSASKEPNLQIYAFPF